MAEPVVKRLRGQHVFDKIVTGAIYGFPCEAKETAKIVTTDLFTISGGLVRIEAIVGHVTVAAHATANATKLTHTLTGGSAVDLSATLEMNACAQHLLLSITGTKANAMVKSTDAGVSIAPLASALVLLPGKITMHSAADTTGKVKWYILYTPLHPDAVIAPI